MTKRLLLLTMLLVMVTAVWGREVISLNRDWKFNSGVYIDQRTAKDITVPHVWSKGEGNESIVGTGSYFREFPVPDNWIDKRVYIKFNGVATVANLFINGRFAGEHSGAFTAFTFEITPFLIYGQINSIMVNVNNTPLFDVMPYVGEMKLYGGIYRDVELIVTNKNHISLTDYSSDGVYITQKSLSSEMAELETKVLLEGRSGSNIDTQVNFYSDSTLVSSVSDRVQIESNGRAEIIIPSTISNPRLWNGTIDPYLYRVEVKTTDNIGEGDLVECSFGLRTVEVNREDGFILNGEPYELKGVTKYQDRSGVGSAVSAVNNLEDMQIIEEMGANAIRMLYGPQSEQVFDLCDRAGMVVWSELPLIGGEHFMGKGFVDSYSFRLNGERQLMEMIKQNYNHPSIAFWGIFNEITQKGDNPITYIQQLNTLAHIESPGRLTAAASNEDGDINFITDVVAWNQYFGWKVGSTENVNLWIDAFRNGWKNLMPGLSGYGAGANILHQQEEVKQTYEDDKWHPENWQRVFHTNYLKSLKNTSFLWGKFVNTMFDYGTTKNSGAGMDGVNNMGLVTFDRHTKKDAFYLYKANWNDSDSFVHITDRRNTMRNRAQQNITVYTNLPSAELFVNGRSMGERNAVDGIVTWDNVTLKRGKNEIDAFAGSQQDHIEVEHLRELGE